MEITPYSFECRLFKSDDFKDGRALITHVAVYGLSQERLWWAPIRWDHWRNFHLDRVHGEIGGDAYFALSQEEQDEYRLFIQASGKVYGAIEELLDFKWDASLPDAYSIADAKKDFTPSLDSAEGESVGRAYFFIGVVLDLPRVETFFLDKSWGCSLRSPDSINDNNGKQLDPDYKPTPDDSFGAGFYRQFVSFIAFVKAVGARFGCNGAAYRVRNEFQNLIKVLRVCGIEHVDCVAIAYDKVEKALADLYTALLEAERRVHAEQNQGEALRQIQEKADKIDARTIKIDETTDKIQGTTGKIYGIVNWLKEAWETIRKRLNPKGGRKPDKEASEEMRRLFELLAERLKKILNDPKNTKERQSLSCVARWVLNDYLDSNYNKFDALKWGKKRGRKFDLGMAVKTFLRNFRNEEAYKEIVSNYLSPKGPNARKRPPSGATPAD